MKGFFILISLLVVITAMVLVVVFTGGDTNYNLKLSLKINSINEDIKKNSIDIGQKINIPLYYVNLERSKDRRETLESQIKGTSIKSKRIEAVDGRNLKSTTGTYKFPKGKTINYSFVNFEKCPKNKFSKSELACTMSHLLAINTAYKEGHDLALIVEDDVFLGLSSIWKEDLRTLVSNAPEDWGIIQLCIGSPRDIDLESVSKKGFFKYLHGYGAVAYIVNKRGMESFSHFFNNDDMNIVNENFTGAYADGVIYENVENKNLGAYVIFPRFVPMNHKNKSTLCHDNIFVTKFAVSIIDKYLENINL